MFNNISIYIGIISRHEGHWGMFTSFQHAASVVAQKYQVRCLLAPHVGDSLLCRARNEVMHKFLQTDAEYLFTLDDDIAIPPNAFIDLLEADKDLIGGIYRLKTEDEKRLAARALYDIESPGDAIKNKEIHEFEYISTGCIMYKREFCQRMWDYYKDELGYEDKKNPDSSDKERVALYQPMIWNKEYLSEDWAFCRRAINMGTKIYAHFGVPCGHWGLKEYTMYSK